MGQTDHESPGTCPTTRTVVVAVTAAGTVRSAQFFAGIIVLVFRVSGI